MDAGLQREIAAANARAGKDRQKVIAKKQWLLKTDRQALELICQRAEEFANGGGPAGLAALLEAVKLARKRLEGK